ncbi:ATP-grasp domain-containing protein [Rhizobium leguminosarum]|uniref:ATP-grasp domain-containing protein n=1 Tax=Rhizobium leguminosarum TaxID=384 RepID=UPI003F9DFE94
MSEVYFIESNMAGNAANSMLRAKDLGFTSIFLTKNPNDYINAQMNPCTYADYTFEVDALDATALLYFFADRNPMGIVAFDDFHVIPAALASLQRGLYDQSYLQGVLNVRFKNRTRCLTNGIAHPVKFRVFDLRLHTPTSPIGYPCIVKPIDESGSQGVRLCLDDHDFEQSLECIAGWTVNSSGYTPAKSILIEEYIGGDEFSAEYVWNAAGERWVRIGFTRKFVTGGSYRIETGHVFPFEFEDMEGDLIDHVLVNCLRAVGLRNTVAHIEFKIVNGIPCIMEINPRLPGDRIPVLIERAYGIDLFSLHLKAQLDIFAPDEEFKPRIRRGAAIAFLLPSEPGRITKITDEGHMLELEGTSSFKSGPIDVREVRSSDDRLGHVLVTAATPDLAAEGAAKWLSNVRVSYDNS